MIHVTLGGWQIKLPFLHIDVSVSPNLSTGFNDIELKWQREIVVGMMVVVDR